MRARAAIPGGLILGFVVVWLGAIGPADVSALGVAATTKTSVVVHNVLHNAVTSSAFGQPIHPSVTVTSSSTPSGKVIVALYAGGTCSGSPILASPQTTLGGGGTIDMTSFLITPSTVGSFSVKATFIGNASFLPSTSTCRALTITKATPTVRVEPHNSAHAVVTSVEIGRSVHARVTLLGYGGTPTGLAHYVIYDGSNCTGSLRQLEDLHIGTTGIIETGLRTELVLRAYSMRVSYDGNSLFNAGMSACKPISWTKATPTVNIFIHKPDHSADPDIRVGTRIHPASAVVKPVAALATPTGTVTINFFNTDDCSGTASPSVVGVPLVDGVLDNADQSFLQATGGQRSVRIHYDGDAKFLARNSLCRIYYVDKAATTPALKVHNAAHSQPAEIRAGATVHPYVSFNGVANIPKPSGTVDFYFIVGPCGNDPTSVVMGVPLVNGAADGTGLAKKLDPGDYSFEVQYHGDAAYHLSTGCTTFTVLAATATPKPTVKPTATPRVTAPPAATAVPTAVAGPTTAPGGSTAPTASTAPGASEAPVASGESAEPTIPGVSPAATAPGESGAPAGSSGPSGSGSPNASAAPGFEVGASVAGLPLFAWLGIIVLGAILLLFIGWRLGRRGPAPPAPKDPGST